MSYHRSSSSSSSSSSCCKRPDQVTSKIVKSVTDDIENLKLKVAKLESIIDELDKKDKQKDVEIASLRYYFSNEWKEHVEQSQKAGPRGRFNEV